MVINFVIAVAVQDCELFSTTTNFVTKLIIDFKIVFQNGDVCISILHPPVDDPQSGEMASERWNPTQNVR